MIYISDDVGQDEPRFEGGVILAPEPRTLSLLLLLLSGLFAQQ